MNYIIDPNAKRPGDGSPSYEAQLRIEVAALQDALRALSPVADAATEFLAEWDAVLSTFAPSDSVARLRQAVEEANRLAEGLYVADILPTSCRESGVSTSDSSPEAT